MWPILSSVVIHNYKRGAVWMILLSVMGFIWFNAGPDIPAADLKRGDLTPTGLALYGSLVLAMFVTLQELPMEMQSRFHLILLSKPISRTDYLVGKIMGIFSVGVISVIITTIAAYVFLIVQNNDPVPLMNNLILPMFHYILYLWYFAIVAGICGAFLSEAFCIMIIGFAVLGTTAVSIIPSLLEEDIGLSAGILLKGVYYIVPNMWFFRPGQFYEYDILSFIFVLLYTAGYTGILLPSAIKKFNDMSFT